MAVNSTGATVAVQQPLDISGMDLETAMMAVQSNRANLLEAQLKDQIAAVQAKNDQIGKMNQLLGVLNSIQAKVDAGAKAGDTVNISKEDTAALQAAAKSAGITLPAELTPKEITVSWNVKLRDGTSIEVDDAGRKEAETYKGLNWAFRSGDYSGKKGIVSITDGKKGLADTVSPNKGQIDANIQSMKSQIDSMSNSQQMDMLRLQSLSNKRNEAFEIMTNFMKKMADNRGSIVGNMR